MKKTPVPSTPAARAAAAPAPAAAARAVLAAPAARAPAAVLAAVRAALARAIRAARVHRPSSFVHRPPAAAPTRAVTSAASAARPTRAASAAALALALAFAAPARADDYIWCPTMDETGTGGGSGIWNYNNLTWYNTASYRPEALGSAANPFGKTAPATLHFYGTGTITKVSGVYFGDGLSPTGNTLRFHPGTDYTLLANASPTLYTGAGDFILDIAPDASLAFRGEIAATGTPTSTLWLRVGGTAADATSGRLVIQGGGAFQGGDALRIRANNAWTSFVIRDNTTVTFAGANSRIDHVSHLGRVSLENGALALSSGAIIYTGYNTAAADPDPAASYGIAIGAVAPASPGGPGALLTINAAAATALGDPRAAGPAAAGVIFGADAAHAGGTLAITTGTLDTTGIRSNTPRDALILDGATLKVSTRASVNSAPNTAGLDAATDAQLQSRLDHFITGFDGDGDNFITLTGAYSTIDLSGIDLTRTNGAATITSAIRGDATLRVTGADRTLILRGANSFDHLTIISGTVAGDTGSLPLSIQKNVAGTLVFAQEHDAAYTGTLTGNGRFVKAGDGTLTIPIDGTVTLPGAIQIEAGALELTGGAAALAAALPVGVTNNAALIFNLSATGTYAQAIRGTGTLVKTGAASLMLTGANTYTGLTRVEAGALIGGTVAIHGDLYIAAGAYVDLRQTSTSVNETFSGNLTGSGTLRKWVEGLTTLTGSNAAFAGTLYVVAGTLAGTTDSLVGNIQRNNAATTLFDQDFDGAFTGTFLNSGTIRKRGAGAVIVSSSANGGPNTIVEAGTLLLAGDGFLGTQSTTISPAATAGGNGAFTNLVAGAGAIVQVGLDAHAAILSAPAGAPRAAITAASGTVPETLTIKTRLTVTGATLKFDLFDGNQSDYLAAANLTNNGGNTIAIGAFATGTFTLGSAATGPLAASSTLTIDGFPVVPGARRSGTLTNASGLRLVTTQAANLAVTWRGAVSGDWNPTQGNWDGDAAGLFSTGDRVTLDDTLAAGAARAITIAAPGITVSDLIVAGTGGYTLSGAPLAADPAGATGLAGAAGKLTKTGPGTLTLANEKNTFPGGIALAGGVLEFSTAAQLGSPAQPGAAAAPVAVTGGTLRALASATLASRFDIAPAAGPGPAAAFDVSSAATLALLGDITAADGAALSKTGPGTLLLAGANTLPALTLAGGTLALAGPAAAPATLRAAAGDGGGGATLRFDAPGLDAATALDLADAPLTADTAGRDARLSAPLSGTAAFAKTGAGALALDADNTAFTGALAVHAGVLSASSPAGLGSGDAPAAIAAGATLALAEPAAAAPAPGPAALVWTRPLLGGGALAVSLAGAADTLAFAAGAGAAFTGTVALARGSIDLDAANLDALALATLSLAPGASATLAASGAAGGLAFDGGLLKIELAADAGSASGIAPAHLLTVDNLRVTSGTLALNLAALDGAPVLNPGVPSLFEQSRLIETRLIAAAAVTGAGARLDLVKSDGSAFALPVRVDVIQSAGGGAGAGEIVARADYNYIAEAAAGGLYLGSGLTAVEILAGKTLLLDNDGAADSDFRARLTGDGGVEIRAGGTITLSHADNDFAGPAVLAAGVLKVTRENALASSSAVALTAGATLDTGGLSQELANLSGIGTLLLGGGTLALRATADTAYAGLIATDAGARLVKTGAAAATLGGASAFDGGLDVRAGALRLVGDAAASAAAAAIAIAPGATLVFENTARDFAAPLAGGGALALVNARARLGAANALSALSLSAGARAQVAHASALGGAASAVTVAAGSVLELLSPATGTLAAAAGTLVVDGGKLVFGENTSLAATGSVSFKNHAAVALSGPLPTGRHTLVTGGAGIACDNPVTLLPDYAPSQAGLDVSLALEGKNLVMSVYNQSAGPAKDIAMARDTVLAALAAVYGRVSESLLAPLAEHAPRAPARDFWLKGFGSDGDYEQTPMQTGFTDRTCGVLAGYDRVFGQKLLLGAWAGLATGRLETSNAASAAADQQLFGAYSALKLGRWHIGADVAAGFTQADTARDEHAGAALGCYEAASLSASAELGFTLAAWARGAVRPAVSLHHTAMRYKNQMEKGPGAVIVPDFTHRFTQSFLRLAASQGFTLPWGAPAMLDVSAGWRHNLAGDRCRVALAYATDPSAPLQVEAAGCTRGAVVAGLGLRAEISKSMSFGLGYDHEVAAARARHSLNAIARWRW